MTQYLAIYRASNGDLRRIRCQTRDAAEAYRSIALSHGCELRIYSHEKRGRWRSTFTLPKQGWGSGPWQDEPDELTWRDKRTNLHCAIRRSDVSGSLCGYVAVSRHHPLWAKHYDEIDTDIRVHGGLTFSRPGTLIGSRAPMRWWYGFDTAHAWDYSPHMRALTRSLDARHLGVEIEGLAEIEDRLALNEVYRDLAYVTSEVESLARQLQAIPRKGRRVCVDSVDGASTEDCVP